MNENTDKLKPPILYFTVTGDTFNTGIEDVLPTLEVKAQNGDNVPMQAESVGHDSALIAKDSDNAEFKVKHKTMAFGSAHAKQMDKVALVLMPLIFLAVSLIYWGSYLSTRYVHHQ